MRNWNNLDNDEKLIVLFAGFIAALGLAYLNPWGALFGVFIAALVMRKG